VPCDEFCSGLESVVSGRTSSVTAERQHEGIDV
jgi:hypothetical protein